MQAMMVCDGFGMEIWNVVSKKQQFHFKIEIYGQRKRINDTGFNEAIR